MKAEESGLRERLALAGAVALAAIVACYFAAPYYVGVYGDDTCYLMMAWSIFGGGECPYCHLTLDNPYSRGWPAALTLFNLFFGDTPSSYRLVSGIYSVLAAVLFADLCARRSGKLTGGLFALALVTTFGWSQLATVLMTEPYYLLLITLSLWVWGRCDETSTADSVVLGLTSSLAISTRSEGLILLLALAICLVLRRRWKPLAIFLASAAVCYGVFQLLIPPPSSPHGSQVLSFFDGRISLADLVKVWFLNQSVLVGQVFVGGKAWQGQVLGLLFLAAAVDNLVRTPRLRTWPGTWLIAGLAAVLLVWPYIAFRYWFGLMPCWLYLLLMDRPEKLQRAVLGALAAVQLLLLLRGMPGDPSRHYRQLEELYTGAGQLSQKDLVAATYPCNVHAYSHRNGIPVPASQTPGAFAFKIQQAGANAVVLERRLNTIVSVDGGRQSGPPLRADLWLERCPFFEPVYSSEVGVVARLSVTPEALAESVKLWRQAQTVTEPRERLRLVENALQQTPDFPELMLLRFIWAHQEGSASTEDLTKQARHYAELYPHDFQSGLTFLAILSERGAREPVVEIAESFRKEAERLGDARAVEAFRPR